MENGPRASSRATQGEPARLILDNRVRVLNCSAAGCLLETSRPMAVNTVATLHVSFGGKLFEDVVQAVRCVTISAGGNIHHVAARFVSIAPPYAGSLRYVMRKEISELAAWLDHVED